MQGHANIDDIMKDLLFRDNPVIVSVLDFRCCIFAAGSVNIQLYQDPKKHHRGDTM